MNRSMRTLISLSHLTKAKSQGGQIATLLLLLLTICLIFVMVTVNLGNLAVDSTALANAADSAVLGLASNLATKAKMLYEGLGNRYEKCKKRGFLSIIFAIILAIIVLVVCTACVAAIGNVLTGMIAGAVGGAIGAGIQGTSILQGAITGAAIGGSIGGIASGVSGGLVSGLSPEEMVIATSYSGIMAVGSSTILYIPALASSAVAFGALGVASSIYNAAVQYNMPSQLMDQLAKDLGKLSEYDRFREGAFFTALKQVVDDPTKHRDEDDVDGDGNTTELISRFAWWWHKRMLKFAEVRNQQIAPVNDFLAKMKNFRDYIEPTYAGVLHETTTTTTDPDTGEPVTITTESLTPGMLERLDYKWTVDETNDGMETAVAGPADGSIVGLLRPLYTSGYPTSYWEPGPAPAEVNTWLDEECSSSGTPCSPAPASYDQMDALADQLRDMVTFMDGLVPPTFEEWLQHQYGNVSPLGETFSKFWFRRSTWMRQLEQEYNEAMEDINPAMNWEAWRFYFYNPADPDGDDSTYYYMLGQQIAMLQGLRKELVGSANATNLPYDSNNIRDSRLPECDGGVYDTNTPPQCISCPTSGCDVATCTGACHWCMRWNLAHTEFWWYCCLDVDIACSACVVNPPCSFRNSTSLPKDTATMDTDSDDEFGPVIADIDAMIAEMTNFRGAIQEWSDTMDGFIVDLLSGDLGGLNPIRYYWEDSRGLNEVKVQASNFIMPRIKTKKSGGFFKGKVCAVLEHHSDEDNCWIKVTKYPPANVALGVLGRFNPFNRGVSKVGKAYYGVGRVGLKDTKE